MVVILRQSNEQNATLHRGYPKISPMKRIQLLSILLIAGAIALLISASGDMSTYSTFADARQSEKKVKIVGQLARDKEMYYNPGEDPNYFTFYLTDQAGEEQRVVLLAPRPQDFELSEQVVATGRWDAREGFIASSLLLKCPSKYRNEEVFLRSEGMN